MGAIGSTLLAWVADVTEEQQRTLAMAVVGASVGLSFFLAMLLGPLINELYSLSGIFWFTAVLALFGLVWVILAPSPPQSPRSQLNFRHSLKRVCLDPNLVRMNLGVLLLHAILAAMFLYIPSQAIDTLALAEQDLWLFYTIILLIAVLLMAVMMTLARWWVREKQMMLLAVALLVTSQILLLIFGQHPAGFVIAMIIFFTAFTSVEALIPAWISKQISKQGKGMAMGIYSSLQFLGVFGGHLGGILYNSGKITLFCLALCLVFLWLASGIIEKIANQNQEESLGGA